MPRRLKYRYNSTDREADAVVKGIAKRVIVVKSPEAKVFEEAIFIVREDYVKTAGVSRSQLLKQAREAAGFPTSPWPRRAGTAVIAVLSALIGSGAAAAIIHFL